MPSTEALSVERPAPLDYRNLNRAIRDAVKGTEAPQICHALLAEIAANRGLISSPLHPDDSKGPSAEDRVTLAGKAAATISVTYPNVDAPQVMQFSEKEIAAGIYLADHLSINEIDALLLFDESKLLAVRRTDKDVVKAAVVQYQVRRRECLLFLQEILRAPLEIDNTHQGKQFVAALVKERDDLINNHGMPAKIIQRLKSAVEYLRNPSAANKKDYLPEEEMVLLTEALFLLAYTVQFCSADALDMRNVLESVGEMYKQLLDKEEAYINQQKQLGNPHPAASSEFRDYKKISLESCRNLLVLSWMSVLDRGRSADRYDPKLGVATINGLLQDDVFPRQTSSLPTMDDSFALPVTKMDKAVLAAEFVGAVFRLAVAVPDEEEAATTALRVAAYGGCLTYLADDLPNWIQYGAGSMTQDADLYADILEDLALDTAETSLISEFIRWHHTEISRIAENLMLETFQQSNSQSPGYADNRQHSSARSNRHSLPPTPDINGGRTPMSTRMTTPGGTYNPHTPGNPFHMSPSASQHQPTTPFGSTTPGGAFRPPSTPGTPFQPTTPSTSLFPTTPGNATPGGSMLVATPGKPPLPPNRPPPLAGLGGETSRNSFFQLVGPTPKKSEGNVAAPEALQDPNSNYSIQNNLAAQLARFVARAIELSPRKLENESSFKGARYWAGGEGPNCGFIPRMNEALYDLFEVSNQNYRMGGGVGTAFSQLLNDFLLLLAASIGKNNAIHAAHALRYLVNAGDVLISMNQLKKAIDHHISTLNIPNASKHGFAHSRVRILDDQEAQLISGMVNVVRKAAEGLKSQGGINAFLSGLGTDLANRFSSLAFYNVNPVLKASLVKGIQALEDQRATVNFLEKVTQNRSKSLAIINSYEGESGTYMVSVSVLELAKSCTKWREEDYPAEAIHSIAVHFAIEKVLHEWSRRKYVSEVERWRTVQSAASLLLEIGLRDSGNSNRLRMLKIMSVLLTPAPGTGAASTALRSLFSAAGLLRNCDGVNLNDVVGDVQSAVEYYKAWGQVLLVSTAKLGLGETYREMVQTITTCSRVMIGLFEISPGEASSRGLMAANVGDLVVVETNSIVSASSLVLNLTSSHIAAYKYGYSSTACSCVLTLLALAADMNQKIAALLVRSDTANIYPWSTFRSSVAEIIIEACINNEDTREATRQKKDTWPMPIITSALRLVEACLGRDGGYQPGLYLLGLNLDASGRYCGAEYGVLNALLSVVLDTTGMIALMDNPSRSTAAVFVQRLSANTVRKTSYAVLEHLKEYGETQITSRGSGLADEMLFRILDKAPTMGVLVSQSQESINWKALAELITACMSLSSLHARLFPDRESNRSMFAIEDGDMDQLSSTAINGAPSPFELYKLIRQISRGTPRDALFESFKAWYNLMGVRALIDSKNRSFAAGPVFIELAKELLGALSSSEANTETSFVRKDGGYTAASAVVSCVQYICDWERQGVTMDEVQVSNILGLIIQASSGLAGSNVDSSRARTMLYSAFLKVAELARKYVSEEGIARAFGGRVGPRQVSGAEGFLTVCCEDAVNSSSPATKAVSMTATCQVTLMDPTRAIPALNSQSRLRKIIHVGIADSEVRSLIAKSCNRTTLELNSGDPRMAKERAARIVCYAAMALIHAVSTVPNGSRAIVDSGCMECLALILNALETSRMGSFDMDGQQMNAIGMSGVTGNDDAMVDMDMGEFGSGERRAEITGQIASTVAAAISFPDSALVEGAFEVLEKGRGCFSDALRMLRLGRPAYLDTISSMASILSRIPAELFVETKGAYQLRHSLAGSLKVFVEVANGTPQLQQSMDAQICNLGIGFLVRKPVNMKELNCARKKHPIGGTIFDRQVAEERIMCLHSIMAALRSGTNTLLFKPAFGRNEESTPGGNGNQFLLGDGNGMGAEDERYGETEPVGSLVDVVRVAKAALLDIRRLGEESLQAKSIADGDGPSLSLSSIKRKEIGDLCSAKYGVDVASIPDEENQSYTVAKYMRKEAESLRILGNFCIAIFEDCLSILRDYVHLAKSAVLGEGVGVYRGQDNNDNEKTPVGYIGAATGHRLIEDAKHHLLPLCKQVDDITGATWGQKDSSFCKQLSRQIRSYILR